MQNSADQWKGVKVNQKVILEFHRHWLHHIQLNMTPVLKRSLPLWAMKKDVVQDAKSKIYYYTELQSYYEYNLSLPITVLFRGYNSSYATELRCTGNIQFKYESVSSIAFGKKYFVNK